MNYLLEACFAGKVGLVRELLQEVNFCTHNLFQPDFEKTPQRHHLDSGETYYDINDALHVTCCTKNTDVIHLLLQHGANPNKPAMGSTFQFEYEFKTLSECLQKCFFTAERFQGQALHFAAYAASKEVIELLLDNGADINGRDCSGATPILIAVKMEFFHVAQLLLERGAKQIAKDDGTTPLHAACTNGSFAATSATGDTPETSTRASFVKILLKYGGDPRSVNKRGEAPLHQAVGDIYVMNILLQSGVNCNLRDNNGRTALLNASWCIYEEKHSIQTIALKTLLECGADPNIGDNYKNMPLLYACRSGNPDAVKVLLDFGAKPNIYDIRGNTPLHLSLNIEEDEVEKNPTMSVQELAMKRDVIHSIIRELLNHAADASMPDQTWGKTALHIACSWGQKHIVRDLLRFSADVNAIDSEGNTPLHLLRDGTTMQICPQNNHEIATILLQNGAQCDTTNQRGDTLLHCACRSFNRYLIEALVQGGAGVDVQDRLGNTPVMLLLKYITCNYKTMSAQDYNTFKATIKFLLEHGANPNTPNKKGQTPVMLSCLYCDCETVQVILNHGGKPQNRLCKCDGDFLVFYKRLLGHRPLVDGYHQTLPLHIVEAEATAMCFIQNGANITSDILSYACRAGHLLALKSMISMGTDLNVCDSTGVHPLYYSCSRTHTNLDVVKLLLASGADTNVRNPDGYLLPLSCENGNFQLTKLLLKYGADANLFTENTGSSLHVVLKYRTASERLSYGLQWELTGVLLDHGADPNVFIANMSPVQLACKNSCAGVVEFLFNFGGDVQQKADDEKSLLHCAIFHLEKDSVVQREVISLLLKHHINIDSCDEFGNTALHYACDARQSGTVKFLLQQNASTNICNKDGNTPLHLILGCNLDSSQTAHQEHSDVDLNTDLSDCVEYLIQHGADPYLQNLKMQTAMYLAAKNGNLNILKLLLPGCKNKVMFAAPFGKSPLIGAALAGHDDLIEYFVTLPGCSAVDANNALEFLASTKWNAKPKAYNHLLQASKICSLYPECAEHCKHIPDDGRRTPNNSRLCPTLECLKRLEESDSDDALRCEALAIQDRLLGPLNSNLQLSLIDGICQQYLQEGNYRKCIYLWGKSIGIHSKHMESMKQDGSSIALLERCSMIVMPIEIIATKLSRIIREGIEGDALMENMIEVLVLFADIVQRLCDHAVACIEESGSEMTISQETKLRLLQTRIQSIACSYDTLWLFLGLVLNEHYLTEDRYVHAKQLIININKTFYKMEIRSFLLHGLCSFSLNRDLSATSQSSSSRSFIPQYLTGQNISAALVRLLHLLLDCGFDVCLKDSSGNSPMHCVVKDLSALDDSMAERHCHFVQLLLEYGAHADIPNNAGKTPFSQVTDVGSSDSIFGTIIRKTISTSCRLNLKCTAARLVKHYHLPYKNVLPTSLVSFVKLH